MPRKDPSDGDIGATFSPEQPFIFEGNASTGNSLPSTLDLLLKRRFPAGTHPYLVNPF